MAEDLVLYTNPTSRGRVARWMLEEVGRPYRAEILAFGPPMRTPEYLAINPMGKVPALRHGDAVVTEAAAICAYLADAFPEAGLAPPPGDPRRAPYFRWMFFAAGPLEAALTNKALGFKAPPEHRGMVGYGSVEEVVDVLERAIAQGDYVAGDRFSAADVYVGSHVGYGLMAGTLEKRPAFERYWQRVAARPAAVRARELDDALVQRARAGG